MGEVKKKNWADLKERKRKNSNNSVANEWYEKMKHSKTHVALKLVEYGAKNIQSQFVCSRHPSRKCSKKAKKYSSK